MDENYYNQPPTKPEDDNNVGAWIFGVLAMIAIVVVAATWWAAPSAFKQAENTAPAPRVAGLNDQVGKTLTLNGTVAEFINSQAFTMKGDATYKNEVLVISRTPLPAERTQNVAVDGKEPVQVTGKAATFDREAAERDLGSKLDPAKFDQFKNKIVIMADSVSLPNQGYDSSMKSGQGNDKTAAPTERAQNENTTRSENPPAPAQPEKPAEPAVRPPPAPAE